MLRMVFARQFAMSLKTGMNSSKNVLIVMILMEVIVNIAMITNVRNAKKMDIGFFLIYL